MADIDFDELDKAVNDLMTNVDASKRPAGLDDPEEKVVTIPTSADAPTPTPKPLATLTVTPVASPVVTEAPTSPSVPAPTSPSLAVKRRGQFMDIVHPARDMSNSAKPVSRQGATIQPGNDVVAASATQQNASPTLAAETPFATQPQVVAETSAPIPSAWPDPIDMANAVPAAEVAPLVNVATSNDDEAPLASPFLPDTKPEKRPLGNPLMAENASSTTTPAVEPVAQAPVEASVVPLPEEFSGDLMAVESRDLSSHMEQPPAMLPAPAEEPKIEAGQTEALIPAVATPDAAEQQPQAQSLAGGSIAQQYTEQPSSGDQSSGSIYDTATYHQAVEPASPVKKKTPTTVWIVIGIGLLLVGAIAGAAYFYFTR